MKMHSTIVTDLESLKADEAAAILLLSQRLQSDKKSIAMEEFGTYLLSTCTVGGLVKLRRSNGKSVTYEKARRKRIIKSDAKPQSRA